MKTKKVKKSLEKRRKKPKRMILTITLLAFHEYPINTHLKMRKIYSQKLLQSLLALDFSFSL